MAIARVAGRNEGHPARHRCAARRSAGRLSEQASRGGAGRLAGPNQPAPGASRVVGRAQEDWRWAYQVHPRTGLRQCSRRRGARSTPERILECPCAGLPKPCLRGARWACLDRPPNASTGPNRPAWPDLPSVFSGRRFRGRALDLRVSFSRAVHPGAAARLYDGRADQLRASGCADYFARSPLRRLTRKPCGVAAVAEELGRRSTEWAYPRLDSFPYRLQKRAARVAVAARVGWRR